MRLFARFRCASANSRSAISLAAPASAKIGPAGSAPLARPRSGLQFPADQFRDLRDGDLGHHRCSWYGHPRFTIRGDEAQPQLTDQFAALPLCMLRTTVAGSGDKSLRSDHVRRLTGAAKFKLGQLAQLVSCRLQV